MAIDRQRLFGTLYIVVGCLFLIASVFELVASNGTQVAGYIFAVLAAAWLVMGILRRSKAGKTRRLFEEENGEDAGKQHVASSRN
jgi:hypothetical protein